MRASFAALGASLLFVLACAAAEDPPSAAATSSAGATGAGGSAAGGEQAGGSFGFGGGTGGSEETCVPCSEDLSQVLDCDGNVIDTCPEGQLCGAGACMAPCEAMAANKSSVGCDYYAVTLDAMGGGFGGCFVSFVANTWKSPVKIEAAFAGKGGAAPMQIDLAQHARIPKGSGLGVTYEPFDPAVGLLPGEVAILFLANDPVPHGTWMAPAACPVPAAVGLDAHVGFGLNLSTGRGGGFHIQTDLPVVAYQMLPYNAAYAATTGATLLLPTSAWDTNYIAAAAFGAADFMGLPIPPSMSIVAKENDTQVTIVPKVPIQAGLDVAGAGANQKVTYLLEAGKTIEFIQSLELTGSVLQSDKPIGVFAGHLGLRVPANADWSDHAEQQIPPVRALGSEYAVASYRDRVEGIAEKRLHRIVGAVDATVLTFDPPIAGAPAQVDLGTVAELETDEPFLVTSQDQDHPFMVFTYMSGSGALAAKGAPAGYGDSDFVRIVPGPQYLRRYVFFTDPTYPETNLVVVRKAGASGFAEVDLDCAGTLDGWQPIGASGSYQVTRIDLSRHDFEPQGGCDNGRREMTSAEPFGLWVWGWGSPETRAGETNPCDLTKPDNSCDVSYGYPAGENVKPINKVEVPAVPK